MLRTRDGWIRTLDLPRIERALREAEQKTSAELRVSVAPLFWGSVQAAAERAFERLGMRQTRERNGVLIFVVPGRRRFAVLGDAGVHARTGQDLWDEVAAILRRHFSRGAFTEGLVAAIDALGVALAEPFPHAHDDENELPDRVDLNGPSPEP
ncbi:MAG: TPM domain-containing protein [Deltaproteobacteria bacterium]|nr:TPM domain-containing protein [Deltaproteobacteria bacterium]